ncbi:hypothetical protein [Bradyrhizobium sp. 40]|uniref:hypothetical protein n=3 Tax=Nitrobacteraceae TaxID=41294 RepID=UPI002000213A|nr:hypothetical protein [Bradyrhizobium sp. 40]
MRYGARKRGINCDFVNDPSKARVKLFALGVPLPDAIQGQQRGGMNMSMISIAAMPATSETRLADSSFSSFKTILLFCCTGLVASFGLMARGIDLGAGLM